MLVCINITYLLQHTSDVSFTISAACRGKVSGWPRARILGQELRCWDARVSVGYLDLLSTGLFTSSRAVFSFLEFYSQHDFLKPVPIGKYGLPPNCRHEWKSLSYDNAVLLQMVERMIEKQQDSILSTLDLRGERSSTEGSHLASSQKAPFKSSLPLKDLLTDSMNLVARRYSLRGKQDKSAQILEMLAPAEEKGCDMQRSPVNVRSIARDKGSDGVPAEAGVSGVFGGNDEESGAEYQLAPLTRVNRGPVYSSATAEIVLGHTRREARSYTCVAPIELQSNIVDKGYDPPATVFGAALGATVYGAALSASLVGDKMAAELPEDFPDADSFSDEDRPKESARGVGGSASSQSIQKPAAQRLMDLMHLLEDGLINQEEFDTQRAAIIASV